MPLSVKDGMGAWVKDFQDSNAPQFKGKSDKERREMAIAAYMSAKRGNKNEATDKPPFDPDPPKPVAKNSDQTKQSPMSRARQLAKKARDAQKDEGYVSHAQRKAVWANRADGGKGHPDKKNEGVEENNNAPQTAAHRRAMMVGVNRSNKVKLKGFGPDAAKGNMGNPSARAALKVKESVELDESVAKAYEIMKPTKSMNHGVEAIKKHMKVDHGTATKLAKQVMDKVKKGEFKEAVQVDELSKATHDKYQKAAFSNAALGMAKKRMGTMSTKDAYDNEKKRHAGIDRSKYLSRKMKEENLDELKKSTLGNYVKVAAKDAAAKAYGAASAAKDNRADQAGKDFSKSMKRLRGIDTATKKLSKEGVEEAKSFDQKFKDHLKFATSKSPAVQAYMKKRKADRDAAHAKQDPAAVKKNYGPAVIPPGTAYNKARKKGMGPSKAADAVSTAFKNRAKGGKLPK